MATHLEYVTGELGELTVLPCACARVSDHPRLTSSALVTSRDAAAGGAVHSTGRRLRGLSTGRRAMSRASRGRHAA